MGHTYSKVLIHIIFSTKNRRPFLSEEIRPQVFSYLAKIFKEEFGFIHIVGGYRDHVHVLGEIRTHKTIADCVEKLKVSSSHWLKKKMDNPEFYWQEGYAVFAVSESMCKRVFDYIKNQEEHHREMDFTAEIQLYLNKHNIPCKTPIM